MIRGMGNWWPFREGRWQIVSRPTASLRRGLEKLRATTYSVDNATVLCTIQPEILTAVSLLTRNLRPGAHVQLVLNLSRLFAASTTPVNRAWQRREVFKWVVTFDDQKILVSPDKHRRLCSLSHRWSLGHLFTEMKNFRQANWGEYRRNTLQTRN